MISQQIQKSFEQSFGTACFLAYFALLLFSHTHTMTERYLALTAFVSVLFVALFIAAAFLSDRLEGIGPARLSAIACALCTTGSLFLNMLPQPISVIVGPPLALTGSTAFFLVLGKTLAFYNHQERSAFIACAFMTGAGIVAIATAINDTAMLVVSLTLPVLSSLHLFTLKTNAGTFEFMNLADTRKSHQFPLSALLTTALTGLVWGIAFCAISEPADLIASAPVHFALPVALGGLIYLMDTFSGRRFSEGALLRCFATVTFVLIAPMPFASPWLQQLLGTALFFAFALDSITCFAAIGESTRFNQISPYWAFGISLAYYFGGAATGALLFGWAFSLDSATLKIAACFITLLVIVGFSDFVFQNNHPSSESIGDTAKASESLARNESKPTLWQSKIEKVIADYDLTARQQEVFRMLLRGRNAGYIAEKFFISTSTAKAHIHNIYRKLDVHSQQELINLVEEAVVETPNKIESTEAEKDTPPRKPSSNTAKKAFGASRPVSPARQDRPTPGQTHTITIP